jgi:uncharacterized protein (DUF2267 family)
MALEFDKYAMKGNEFINLLAHRLGDDQDRNRAARILRSVFHALRKHLTLEENMELLSHLPMALKGVYVDGWKIVGNRTILDAMNLPEEIVREDAQFSKQDFQCEEDAIKALKIVIELVGTSFEPEVAVCFDEASE